MNRILKNFIRAICIIIYFLILAFAYIRMNTERLTQDIKVFSGIFLGLGLLALEKSYKNDDGKTAITAIELLMLSFYSLSIMHITTLIKCEFTTYMFISCGFVGIYYVLKIIVIYTKKKREDLKKLSDISEIVKKDEPIKKEAKKRNLDKEISKTPKIKDDKKLSDKKGEAKDNNKAKTDKKINDKKSQKSKVIATKKKTIKKEVKKDD